MSLSNLDDPRRGWWDDSVGVDCSNDQDPNLGGGIECLANHRREPFTWPTGAYQQEIQASLPESLFVVEDLDL